jgi:hypothetical protein
VLHKPANHPDSPPPKPYCGLAFRFLFSYAFIHVPGAVSPQDVRCRIPTGVGEFPFQSIVVECPLCGEKRRYLPSEVFLGRVDQLVNRQKRAGAV